MMTDEKYIYDRINQPIEKAASSFNLPKQEPLDHKSFNCIIQHFVTHLFKEGCSCNILSETTANSMAAPLLETGYQTTGNGYYAAFLDAINPDINGVEIVLIQIKETVINLLRSNHIQWVYSTQIVPLEWNIKCAIAELLLEVWKKNSSKHILYEIHPVQMADSLPDLIKEIQKSVDKVTKLMGTFS